MKNYIRITKIRKNKDGSETVYFEYNNKLKETVKKYYNKKRITKKLVNKFIIEALTEYMNRKNRDIPKDLVIG